jgi:elongation factor G
MLSPRCIAVSLPIGAEHELTGIVDLLHEKAYMSPEGARDSKPVDIPAELADQVAQYRTQLIDAVVETDEALMERYLETGEAPAEDLASALKTAVTRGEIFPVSAGVATKNLGTDALLDLLVEGVPSPARKEPVVDLHEADTAAFVFKTVADPFAGRINVFRVERGTLTTDSNLVNARTHQKERTGSLMFMQGKEHVSVSEIGEGDIGAAAKLKDVQTGDVLLDAEREIELPKIDFPEPVMSFAITPKAKGDEEKMGAGLRRLHEEDPTLILRRDPQTGEQLISALSQMAVDVAADRLRSRFGVDVELRQPRVPYLETIRKESRAQGRYKKQTGGRGQFGDCHIVVTPTQEVEYEFVDKIVGGVIPQSFRPAVDKGIQEAMHHGELAGAPVQGVRVQLVDGSYHEVDSSEMAFKIAGSMGLKDAARKAGPVLLEPVMEFEVTTPEEFIGDVMGDVTARRGRIENIDERAGQKSVRVLVPLAELFGYATELRSRTQGRAAHSPMSLHAYNEVPSQIAKEIVARVTGE